MTYPQDNRPDQPPNSSRWQQQPPQGSPWQPTAPNPPQYGQGYGYPPPPGPPKKKSKKWPWIVGAVVALVAAIAIGTSGGTDGEKDSSSTQTPASAPLAPGAPANEEKPPASAPAEPPIAASPGLNTPVRDGKFEFVVTQVDTGIKTLGDNPYMTQTAQGEYTIVHLSVLNTSDQPQGFSPSSQDLYDQQGRKFTNDAMAAMNLEADTSIWSDINPGNTVTATVVYDMPVGAIPTEIELHDSMFSGGTRVTLR